MVRKVTARGPRKGGNKANIWAYSAPVEKPLAELKGKWYPAEDKAVEKPAAAPQKPAKLRASITPGTVLILLAGRFKGKRVVFLKQLESGLLLVTGPYKFNGVPLRRVNQAYVIATSKKVSLSGVDCGKVKDDFFKRPVVKTKPGEKEFFSGAPEKKAVPSAVVAMQKAVDDKLVASLAKDKDVKSYLATRFSLRSGDRPHLMKF
ncbi:unnamed protein product [Pedinophyceae sp. YPF-701]|nr:unnamed protein product [Pedinophyceae sp. YPF-701]